MKGRKFYILYRILLSLVISISSMSSFANSIMSGKNFDYVETVSFIDDSVMHSIMLITPEIQGNSSVYKWYAFLVCKKNSYYIRLTGINEVVESFPMKQTDDLPDSMKDSRWNNVLRRYGSEPAIKKSEWVNEDGDGFWFHIFPSDEQKLLSSDSLTLQFNLADGRSIAVRFDLKEMKPAYQRLIDHCEYHKHVLKQ